MGYHKDRADKLEEENRELKAKLELAEEEIDLFKKAQSKKPLADKQEGFKPYAEDMAFLTPLKKTNKMSDFIRDAVHEKIQKEKDY